jgi:hypothetical protein
MDMMDSEHIGLDTHWPEEYSPDWDALGTATGGRPFHTAAQKMLIEAATVSTLAALVPESPYGRNDAILCALMVKASKLAKQMIGLSIYASADRQLALTREIIEALAILNYLIGDPGDGSRFKQYINDSLVCEREFSKTISENVQKRGPS